MLNKQGFKFTLIVSAIFWIAAGSAFADSASNNGTPFTPATVTSNQTYLLDSGRVDFAPNSSLLDAATGLVCNPTSTTPGCSNSLDKAHGRGVCPVGFVPYISTILSKTIDASLSSSGMTPGMKAVCPSFFWANSTLGYDFQFKSTMASSNGTTTGTSVAFDWAIYCIPGLYTTTTPTPVSPNGWTYTGTCTTTPGANCWGQAPTSGQGACSITASTTPQGPSYAVDAIPLVWDKGTIPAGTANYSLIYTNRLCPPGYNPLVSLSLYSSQTAYSQQSPGQGFMCVAINSGTGVPIFNTNATNYSFSIWSSAFMDTTTNTDANWTVTCYPPGMTVPTLPKCNVAETVTPVPYILDQGTMGSSGNLASYSTSTGYFFWSPRQCASGWVPYANVWANSTAISYAGTMTHNGGFVRAMNTTCTAWNGTIVKFYDYIVQNENTYYGGISTVGYTIWCYPPGTTPGYQQGDSPGVAQWYNITSNVLASPPC